MQDGFGSDPIDLILDEALRRVRQGAPFDIESYCAAHPDLADELRLLLPAMLLLERPTVGLAPRIPSSLASLTDYEIRREIGHGAMGTVYEAFQRSLHRRVALKVIQREGVRTEVPLQRFLREAETAAKLQHPNIIAIYASGQTEEIAYYSMQLIEGWNLQQLLAGVQFGEESLREETRLGDVRGWQSTDRAMGRQDSTQPKARDRETLISPRAGGSTDRGHVRRGDSPYDLHAPRTSATIAMQIADGLAYAHERGILHRDIKPSNVMLDVTGHAWIADFGLAYIDDTLDLTATGEIVGTLRYMAPECFQGRGDARSDVYSLGLTLFELLEGQPAFLHQDRAKLIHQILHGPGPKFTARVPTDLGTICLKCVASDPADRYGSAQELVDDLQRYLAGRPIAARPIGPLRRLARWGQQNPILVILMLVLSMTSVIYLGSTWLMAHRHQALQDQSEEQFALAKQNLGLLLGSIDQLTRTVESEYQLDHPEIKRLRGDLLETAVAFQQAMVDRPDVAADSQYQLARIYMRLGLLGNRSDTLSERRNYLTQAVALLDGLRGARTWDLEMGIDALRCEIGLGMACFRMNAVEESERVYGRALAESEEMLRSLSPSSPYYARVKVQRAQAWTSQAKGHLDTLQYAKVEGPIQRAVHELEEAMVAIPNDVEMQTELAESLMLLGTYYTNNIRLWKSAVEPFERSSEWYERILRANPDRPDLMAKRSKLLMRRARLAFMANEKEQTITLQSEAIRGLREVIAKRPAVKAYRADLSTALRRLGEYSLSNDSNSEQVERYLAEAEQIQAGLVESDPEDTIGLIELEKIYMMTSEYLLKIGRESEALEKVEAAADVLEGILKEKTHPMALEQLHDVASTRATLLTSRGEYGAALRDWDLAIESSSPAMLSVTKMKRTRTQVFSGDIEGALSGVEALLVGLKPKEMSNGHLLREATRAYALAYDQLGKGSLTSQEDRERREGYARRVIELMTQLREYPLLYESYLKTSADLDGLRDRADFLALQNGLTTTASTAQP